MESKTIPLATIMTTEVTTTDGELHHIQVENDEHYIRLRISEGVVLPSGLAPGPTKVLVEMNDHEALELIGALARHVRSVVVGRIGVEEDFEPSEGDREPFLDHNDLD